MIDFTEKDNLVIAEFIHANETDTLIVTEVENLINVLNKHGLIENNKNWLDRLKVKDCCLVDNLIEILDTKISVEQGILIMNEYYGVK